MFLATEEGLYVAGTSGSHRWLYPVTFRERY